MTVPYAIRDLARDELLLYQALSQSLAQDSSAEAVPIAYASTVSSVNGSSVNGSSDDDLPPPYTPQATPAETVLLNTPAPARTPLPDGPSFQRRESEWRYIDGEWIHSSDQFALQPQDDEWQYSDGEWRHSSERSSLQPRDGEWQYIDGEWRHSSDLLPYIRYGESFSGRSPFDRNQRSIDFTYGHEASGSSLYIQGQSVVPGGSLRSVPSLESDFSINSPRHSSPGSRPIHDKGDMRWSSAHLRATRASLASNPKSRHAIKKQTLEEMRLRERGVELRGPPPVRVRRRRHPTTIESARDGNDYCDEPLSPELDYSPLGENVPAPHPPPELSVDPLDAEIGTPTVRISNPSIVMGALMPKKHFPGAAIEYGIPATNYSPDLVMLVPHECDTLCPEDCRQAGGKKQKGKENAEYEASDDDCERSNDEGGGEEGGPEPMEGVLYGVDPAQQADDERVPTKEEQEEDIAIKMGDWAIIDRHRGRQVAESGAISSARLPKAERQNVSLNSEKQRPSESEREDPARVVREKVIDLVERRAEDAREAEREYERQLHRDLETELLKKQAEDLEARRHVREAKKAAKAARRAARAEARTAEEKAREAAAAVEDEVAVDSVSSGSSSGEDRAVNSRRRCRPDDQATAVHVEDAEMADQPTTGHVEVAEVVEDDANAECKRREPERREPPAIWILQRDGTFIRNPLAYASTSTGAPSDPLPRRRWSSSALGNIVTADPVPSPDPIPDNRPPPSPRPRHRSLTGSEGEELIDSPPRDSPLQPSLSLLLEPVQVPRLGAVRADDRPRQDDSVGSGSSEGGFDMSRPRLRRESFSVADIRPREEEPPHGTFGPDSAALVADAGGSQIPLIVPTTETTNQGGDDSGSDDEWLDEIDEGPVRREPGLMTITTLPRPSEEDLPNRPRYSASILRTEILLDDIFSDDLDLTPAIEATHVPFSRGQSPSYFPSPSALSGARLVQELPGLERFISSYRETNAPSPVSLTTFTSVATEADTPAVTSVPATPACGPCLPLPGLDALAQEQAAHVSRAFGVSVGGDGAADRPAADNSYAGSWGGRYFPSSPILAAPRPGPRSPPMEPHRWPSDGSIASIASLRAQQQQQQQRGEEIVAGAEREGSVTGEVVEMVRGLGVGSPLGREGSATGEVVETLREMGVGSPLGGDGEEELLRKREEEVSVKAEEDGEEGADGAPLQRVSSQMR